MNPKYLLFLGIILLTPFGCKDDEAGSQITDCFSEFNQEALFTNLAYELIIPGYEVLKTDLDKLSLLTANFLLTPDEFALESLRDHFIISWINWEKIAAFEFGPAETQFLRNSLNNFPTDTVSILENIQNGGYDFSQPDRFDKGFPALDYLLFGSAATSLEIAMLFENSQSHRDYLLALVTDMQQRAGETLDAWLNGYADSFIQNTGTAAGTSLSLIINNLNQFYEIIKRDQIGIPSGVLTLGFSNPDKVEAFYSGVSLDLAKAALAGNRNFYLGNSYAGETGQGLDDYLEHVDAKKDGQSLNQLIQDQYAKATDALEALELPLSEAVDEDAEGVSNAYIELTLQLVQLKTDLPSVLCVSITYIDNPSDSD